MDGWPANVEHERAERNAHYLGPDSPLSPESQEDFQGLRWFPIDLRYRLSAKLTRHAHPKPSSLAATGGESLVMMEIGVFEFNLLGTPCRLLAFSPAAGQVDEDYILVPFRDGTTGEETYGAGRYLDLEPHAPDDVFDLDFNRAYHPYCAHDDQWSCTLPPPENRLPVRVEAGERLA